MEEDRRKKHGRRIAWRVHFSPTACETQMILISFGMSSVTKRCCREKRNRTVLRLDRATGLVSGGGSLACGTLAARNHKDVQGCIHENREPKLAGMGYAHKPAF